MRIFGNKVIALNKGQRESKFKPEDESYLLVDYSEESKAYRLWKPGTEKVIKRRDVCFNKKLSGKSIKEDAHFEAPINILEINPKSMDAEVIEERIKEDTNNDEENKVQILLRGEENKDQTLSREEESDETIIIKQASGQSTILKTDKRGRPRKLFHETSNLAYTNDPHEPYNVKGLTQKR